MTGDVVISETTSWADVKWQRGRVHMTAGGSKKEPSESIIYRFEPERDNEFLTGVPPRDLTKADVDALEPEQLRNVQASSIYVKAKATSEKKMEDDE